ncbi:hypothetical protein [Maribacter sp. 2307UL18-2]|uniref:hypothetical protein n=1 Tax=Maribacter sp. 2307UL18-2 TaxID=3386274 RepID=UPI0039BC2ECD
MNDFLIIHSTIESKYLSDNVIELADQWCIYTRNDVYSDFQNEEKRYLVFGDLIDSKELLFTTQDEDIPKLKGNFYIVVIDSERIKIYQSFFSLLPIYITNDKKLIGTSYHWIEQHAQGSLQIDKKFILENLLFNYGFFNRTKYKEIKLLPCNSFIKLQGQDATIQNHFEVINFYKNCKKAKTANQLSNLFIGTTASYFPDEHFHIAFTSGFDGRTLVSCASYLQKNFSTFSFGRPANDDVTIPKNNAKSLSIPYEYFNLGTTEYIQEAYAKSANAFTTSGCLGNGFLYAHFPFSAKEISRKSNYLISGVCGSELFRALHTAGAVTSQALTDVFKINTKTELRVRLKNSKTLEVLNKQEFETELDELIEEVIAYKEGLPQNISLNQQFYVFVFEEIFRKFFGQWVMSQQQYLNVRTPFLDFDFVKALLESKYAGANNDFFTKNPLKRVKGQYIYADIIRKTNTTIYQQLTGKGYTPRDVRSPLHRLNIILPFIQKRLKRKVKKTYLDNLGIVSGVQHYRVVLQSLFHKTPLFDDKELSNRLANLSDFTPEKERDTLLMSLAILYNLQDEKITTKLKIA